MSHALRRLLPTLSSRFTRSTIPSNRTLHTSRLLNQQQQPKQSSNNADSSMGVLAGLAGLVGGYLYFANLHEKNQASSSHSHSHSEEDDSKSKLKLDKLPSDTFVVFVLGGPGAGKGTMSNHLVRDYGFVHLSAGDLLRAERQRPGSEYGELINSYIKEGLIVPMEITIALLYNAMKASKGDRFLIDGFPRKMDQALKFEEVVCPSQFTLYFECPEGEMEKRLLKRGETSGRVDDNIESIRKRFQTFKDTSFPVIEHYQKLGKVEQISCLNTVDKVYAETKKVVDKRLAMALGKH